MALSNSERQARWRAKLKAQAAMGNARLLDVFREHMRAILLRDADLSDGFSEEERQVWIEAAENLISRKDRELMEVLNSLVETWHRDECVEISNARRRLAFESAKRGEQ
jgi:hypothetical protein